MSAAGAAGGGSLAGDGDDGGSALFWQFLALQLALYLVPSLRHPHWQRGSEEHRQYLVQAQHVPSRGQVVRGSKSRALERGRPLRLVSSLSRRCDGVVRIESVGVKGTKGTSYPSAGFVERGRASASDALGIKMVVLRFFGFFFVLFRWLLLLPWGRSTSARIFRTVNGRWLEF